MPARLRPLVLSLLLVGSTHLVPSEAHCPLDAVYIPSETIANSSAVWASAKSASPGLAAYPVSACCPRGEQIVEWDITTANDSEYIASIGARCTYGAELPPVTAGFQGPDAPACETDFDLPSIAHATPLYNDFTYKFTDRVVSFLGFGGGAQLDEWHVTCDEGEVPVGFKASSKCDGLALLQVICAAPQPPAAPTTLVERIEASCPLVEQIIPNQPLGWWATIWTTDTLNGSLSQAGPQEFRCCESGPVTAWRIQEVGNGSFVGAISPQCSNGTFLEAVEYGGQWGNGTVCYDKLTLPSTVPSPANGRLEYKAEAVLNEFMRIGDETRDSNIEEESFLQCDPELLPFGYIASPSCMGLTLLQVLCGRPFTGAAITTAPPPLLPTAVAVAHSEAGNPPQSTAASSWITGLFMGVVLGGVALGFTVCIVWGRGSIMKPRNQRKPSDFEPSEVEDGSLNPFLTTRPSMEMAVQADTEQGPAPAAGAGPILDSLAEGPATPSVELSIARRDVSREATSISGTSSSCGPAGQSWPSGSRETSSQQGDSGSPIDQISFEDLVFTRVGGKIAQLGTGAFGTVLKGEWQGIPVAIKIVQSTASEKDLLHEANLLRALRHGNIVALYGICKQGEELYLVMEEMEQDLFKALHRSLKETYRWRNQGKQVALQVAQGLRFLHAKGIIHNDLKSNNVLLSSDGTAKISDVGLSRVLDPAQSHLSLGSRGFTWQYAPPEVILRTAPCRTSADIYSFGVLLWEIVTGEIPRFGPLDVRVPAQCPQEIADLIKHCVQTEPEARPTANTVFHVLKTCAEGSV